MKITSGQRPTRPATILRSDALWTLITDCWSHESRSRPIMSAVLSSLRAEAPFRAGNIPQGRGRIRLSASYTDRADIRDLWPNEQSSVFAEARRECMPVPPVNLLSSDMNTPPFVLSSSVPDRSVTSEERVWHDPQATYAASSDPRAAPSNTRSSLRGARELIPVPQTRLCGLTLSARSMRELFIPVDAAAGAAILIVITKHIGQPLPDFLPALTLSSPWTRSTCTTHKSPDSLLRPTEMQALVRCTDTPFSPMMRLPTLLCTHMPMATLISGARLQYLGTSHRSWS
jgi:hypothetical protein